MTPGPPGSRKVLLIGWDAADWKVINPLMDAGKMPNVQRLVDNGCMAQIATLHPPLSPMLWTSIATGKRPFQHGIHGFSEPTPDGQGVQPVTNLSRKCKALWNILNQNGLRSIVVGWWPSHPAEPIHGVTVSDHYHRVRSSGKGKKGWPMLPGTVHPPELAETLARLRFHPREVIGEMIDQFVPLARKIDQKKDRRLAGLTRTLCECVSIHSAATWLLDNQPWDFCGVYYDAIDHFCHGFMRYHPPRQAHISEGDFELYRNVVNAAYLFHDQMLGALLKRVGPETRVILMSDHGFHPDHLRPRSIPAIPAGPAVEHRDFGILAISGPGIKKDELLHGASVLDITPTILTMFGLPVGADMAGKVLRGAFEMAPGVESIPSWEDVPGDDGRHPPHTRLDAVSAQESMEQMVALGYIERPAENREKAIADTVAELQYNLGESYQDDDRHSDAIGIFRELYKSNPDAQRYAVHLFVSCQALGLVDEMSAIVDDLDGRRRRKYQDAVKRYRELRALARERFEERKKKAAPQPADAETEAEEAIAAELPQLGETPPEPSRVKPREPLLNEAERAEWKTVRDALNFQPPVVDYLKAQVFTARRYWGKALECLERVHDAHLLRPGLFLQTADLYVKMRQWEDAGRTYAKALTIDPDNPHAHIGMARVALHRRDYEVAAQSALDGLERLFHYPLGHFLLGVAAAGMRNYERAADAFRAAIGLNPNFPQAHLRLAYVLKRRLNDQAGAERHFAQFRELRKRGAGTVPAKAAEAKPAAKIAVPDRNIQKLQNLPPLNGEVVIVSGLPRSGTSMIMQMLAAGGVPALTDGLRAADEDNPRGYFEYEPVKRMLKDAKWLDDAKGKAVKIVAPLLSGLAPGLACRVIFIERDLDEILASQGQMLIRRGEKVDDTPARRIRLKDDYSRRVAKMKLALARRPATNLLCLERGEMLRDSAGAAAINAFLGGICDEARMAAEVDPTLHRQRA